MIRPEWEPITNLLGLQLAACAFTAFWVRLTSRDSITNESVIRAMSSVIILGVFDAGAEKMEVYKRSASIANTSVSVFRLRHRGCVETNSIALILIGQEVISNIAT